MLDSIRLIDFKNHSDTRIGLRELTLLVGPNGAGKSGILQALQLVSRLFHYGSDFRPSPLEHKEVLIRRGCAHAIITLAWKETQEPDSTGERGVSLKIAANGDETFAVAEFSNCGQLHESGMGPSRGLGPGALLIRGLLGVAAYFRLTAPRLAMPSYLGSAAATIASDGYGLASAIAHLMTFERDRFDALEATLRSIMPAVKRIRVRRIEIDDPRSARDPIRVLADA